MGSTAKLMLVGILVLVIVVALVWEKQSTDLQRMTVDNSAAASTQETGSGGFASSAQVQPRVIATVTGRQDNTQQLSDEFESEFIRGPQNQPTPVTGQQPASLQTPSRQSAAPTQSTVRKHKVTDGESLWTIAKRYYSDGTKADLIREANKDKCQRGDLITPGVELVIPDLKETAKEASVAQPASQKPQTHVAQLEIAPDGKRYYTVKEGDVLGSISQKTYGTSKRWKEILEANKNILKDEHGLRVGMRLLIPDANRN